MNRTYVSTNEQLCNIIDRIPAQQLKMAVLVYIQNHGLSLSEKEIFSLIAETAIWFTPIEGSVKTNEESSSNNSP